MKRIILALFVGASLMSWSQCETNVIASDTTICPGDSIIMTASGPASPLTTTFAGGNNHRGNMFDVVAINTVIIESFEGHPMGNTDYEIYYKVGSYVGSETNAGAWTLVGSASNVIAQPMGTPTLIPINVGVTIPAGQTYSFYVTSSIVPNNQNYTNGTMAGAVYVSDGNIQILEGAGLEYPFGGGAGINTPRIWNGIINYSMGTTYLWDNSATSNQIADAPITQSTYYVDITSLGCPTVTDSVTIYMNSVPVVDLGPDTIACPGTQILLDAGNAGSTFDWNNGLMTTQTISVIPGADYFVEVMNADGCLGYDTVQVATGVVPVIDLGADTTICEGTTMQLDAGNAGSTYDWSTAETTQMIDAGTGNYDVTVTSMDGCVDSSSIVISENPAPQVDLGADTTFCVNQSAVLDAGAGFAAYLWSTTETTQSIVADGATLGVGAHVIDVTVTDSVGCTNSSSITLNVDGCVGITPIVSNLLEVYPNPTSGELMVELNELSATAEIVIYSTDGAVVFSQTMNSTSLQLDLGSLATGSYILELTTEDAREVIRLVKD